MGNVRAIFRKNVADFEGTGGGAPSYAIFRDQARAEKSFSEFAQGPARFHVAPRTRQVFRKLRPLLLQQLAKTADPDATLNQLLRFVEAYGLRSLLFEILAVNPRLLELLIKTFDVSRYAGDLLVRHPQLLEETTRSRKLDQPLEVGEHLRRLAGCGASPRGIATGAHLSANAMASHSLARHPRAFPTRSRWRVNNPPWRKHASFHVEPTARCEKRA